MRTRKRKRPNSRGRESGQKQKKRINSEKHNKYSDRLPPSILKMIWHDLYVIDNDLPRPLLHLKPDPRKERCLDVARKSRKKVSHG